MMAPRCLLVDDEPGLLRLVTRILENHCNMDVVTAPNAIVALQHLNTGRFDILVTDEGMPGPSGTILLKTAKEKWPLMRRVLLTGDSTSEQIRSGVADAVIDKIFSSKVIASKICRLATTDRSVI